MNLCARYGFAPDRDQIGRDLETLSSNLEALVSPEIIKNCISFLDLTSLKNQDTVQSVTKFTGKVNALAKAYPDFPAPASVCVYPNLVATVKSELKVSGVHVTSVSGCFPTSQSFIEVKMKECEMAVEAGADEIDIVLALNSFLAGDYMTAGDEIRKIRECIDNTAARLGRKVILKVILETGLLMTPENIAEASFLAMEEGADFIKTSTGKVDVNATPVAAYVMCQCIRRYFEITGKVVGFKAAGGISTTLDAVCYYSIVSSVLGKDWLCKERFRFGVSRLANSLLSSYEQKTVSFF